MSVCPFSYSYIEENSYKKIHVKQYGINIYNDDALYVDITIKYNNDNWILTFINYNGDESSYSTIRYDITEKLMINSLFSTVNLDVESTDVNYAKDVNITLINEPFPYYESIDFADNIVEFITNGDWNSIKEANIYYNAYQKLVQLNTDNCNEKVKFIKGLPNNLPEDYPFEETKTKQQIMSSASLIIPTSKIDYCEFIYKSCENNTNCIFDFGIKKVYCIGYDNISEALSFVVDDSDGVVMLLEDAYDYEVDLNQLNSKKPVYILNSGLFSMDLKTKKSVNHLFKKEKRTNLNAKEYEYNVTIKGDIKDKVSYLFTYSITLNIIESPLNVEKIDLLQTFITQNSQQIQSSQLGIDIETFYDLFMFEDHLDITEFIQVQNLIINDMGIINMFYYRFMVKFDDNAWYIHFLDIESELNYDNESFITIPYSICDNLNFISASHFYDLNLVKKGLTKTKPINITLLNYVSPFFYIFHLSEEARFLEEDKKFLVKFTTFGDWSENTVVTPVYFTAYQDLVEIEKDINSKVDIIKYIIGPDGSVKPEKPETTESMSDEEPGSYIPTQAATLPPIEINDTLIKDNNYIDGTLDLSKIEADKYKDTIKSKFGENKNNENKDNIIVAEGNKLEFSDLDLQSDQYLKFSDNTELTIKGGNLNVFLGDNTQSLKVNLADNNKINLAIKNTESSTITLDAPESKDGKLKDISISSISEIYDSLKLQVGKNINSVNIDSINLHKSGKISAEKDGKEMIITVNNLVAHPKTSCNLNNIIITNELKVSQSAELNVNNIIFKNSKLSLDLRTYIHSNYEKAMISGILGDPPKSIILNKPTDNSSPDSNEYRLFEGFFIDKCSNWKDAINFGETKFNIPQCNTTELKLQEEIGALFVKYDENYKGNNDKKKLGTGPIIGIVVGCMAAVAIIVVVVVIVVIKKKNKSNSSDESPKGNNDNNDL